MKWYSKYYNIQDTDPEAISAVIYDEIQQNINHNFTKDNPVVSIVVIAYNEERNLPACLWSLSNIKSKYPMEIIGVNNNSKDRTAQVFEKCGIQSLFQDEYQSPGASRQCGLMHAKGNYYFCIDADLIYPPTYVDAMMDELQKPGVVGVSSKYSYMPDKKHSLLSLRLYEFVKNIHLRMLAAKRPEHVVRGAVFAHNLPLARQIGYRMDIFRGEDGSMALALMKHGKIKFVNNKACTAAIGCSHLGDQSTFGSLINRIKKHLADIRGYFIPKKVRNDQPDNIVNRKNT
ncbi:MAG: glycosyltransferase [Bacteroidales bacterium]